MILTIAMVLLAGCGPTGNKSATTAADTKWKGAPYRISFDKDTSKPNPAAVNIPPIKFTANPDALETRAILVMKFSGPAAAGADPVSHLMIGNPTDVRGAEGSLSPDYMAEASKSITDYLVSHCIQGDVNISVALARSSVKPQADDAEVDSKRLSDWLSFHTTFKKPHVKC